MLQISISTPQCFAYSPQHRRASCCLKLCSDAKSQPAHFGCALSVLKAAKEAGQALVGKAPHPPFESQHHHLLHCLEKTTVKKKKKNPFFLKLKSFVCWKTHNHFCNSHFTVFITDCIQLTVKNSSFYAKLHHFCSPRCIISSASWLQCLTNRNKVSFFIHAQTVQSFHMQPKLKIAVNGDGKMLGPLSSNMLKIT